MSPYAFLNAENNLFIYYPRQGTGEFIHLLVEGSVLPSLLAKGAGLIGIGGSKNAAASKRALPLSRVSLANAQCDTRYKSLGLPPHWSGLDLKLIQPNKT